MKKFMKITVGIVAKIAFVAIVCATAYGVNSVWGDVGVYALLGVGLVGWIVAGFIPDKQALAYAEMQVNLAISEGEVEKLRAERDELFSHTAKLAEELAEAEAGLKNASSTIAELKGLCEDSDAKLKAVTEESEHIMVERNRYHAAWEEATKREEMLHKQLREKQGEVEYWRNKYNQAVDSVVEEAVAETEPDDVEVATPAPEIARHRPIRERRHTKPSKV